MPRCPAPVLLRTPVDGGSRSRELANEKQAKKPCTAAGSNCASASRATRHCIISSTDPHHERWLQTPTASKLPPRANCPRGGQGLRTGSAQNPALCTEVDKQRLELRAMELLAEAELRANFPGLESGKVGSGDPAAPKWCPSTATAADLRIAAAASVLLLIGFFAQRLFTGPDQQQLAGQYFDECYLGAGTRPGRHTACATARPCRHGRRELPRRAYAALQAVPDSALAGKVLLLEVLFPAEGF
ncbi:MAG: hypothetical protein R3D58_16290 [Saprospiraceae bacterium]